MNVEDSYEGALRRLQRLEAAGLHAMPVEEIARDTDDRLRDLEELATLACEDNERLKQELASAQVEIQRLRLQVMTLQGSSPAALPAQMPAIARDDDDVIDAYRAATTRRGAGFYFFVLTIVGAAVAAALVLRPWEHKVPTTLVEPAATPSTPAAPTPAAATTTTTSPATTSTPATTTTPSTTTAAPATTTTPATKPAATTPAATTTKPATTSTTAPAATTVVPKVAATIPKVPAAPMVIAPAHAKASRHHAKHHASARKHEGKHGAAAAKEPAIGDTDDPLGGTNL